MRCSTQQGVSGRISRSVGLAAWLVGIALTPAAAQDRIVLQGIFDLEGWATDDASRLLAKNDGRPVGEGVLTVWSAIQLHPRLQVMALGELEAEVGVGSARETHVEIEQLAVRFAASPSLVIEAGMILPPVGIFPSRRFSTTNPVIGSPDSYHVGYPWGVVVTGRSGRFDYRAGLVDEGVTHEKYLPEPSAKLRPALGAGVTLTTGLRVGTSFTRGSYLNSSMAPAIEQDVGWDDFDQRILAFDGRFSRGHFELRSEFSLSSYDVPTLDGPVEGKAGYVELKQTLSPRLFSAVRLEGNDYAIVRLRDSGEWFARAVQFFNAEAGLGYRFSRDSLFKVSYRRDRWSDADNNGYALAFQFSRRFDVMGWIDQGALR